MNSNEEIILSSLCDRIMAFCNRLNKRLDEYGEFPSSLHEQPVPQPPYGHPPLVDAGFHPPHAQPPDPPDWLLPYRPYDWGAHYFHNQPTPSHDYHQPPLPYLQQHPQSYRQPPLTVAAAASLPHQNYQPDGQQPCTEWWPTNHYHHAVYCCEQPTDLHQHHTHGQDHHQHHQYPQLVQPGEAYWQQHHQYREPVFNQQPPPQCLPAGWHTPSHHRSTEPLPTVAPPPAVISLPCSPDIRDASGFAVRPQPLQRYQEYANIYKEEEEEERWKDLLERQSGSGRLPVNGSIEINANDSQGKVADSDGNQTELTISDEENSNLPSEIDGKVLRVQTGTEIRSPLCAIGDHMSSRVNKTVSFNKSQLVLAAKKPLHSIVETRLGKGVPEEDSEEELYNAAIDPAKDPQEQVVWLKVEQCLLMEGKRSAELRTEELVLALMEMVKQDNHRQLSAKVEQMQLVEKHEQENTMSRVKHGPPSVIFYGNNEERRSAIRCTFDPGGDISSKLLFSTLFVVSISTLRTR